MHRKNVLILLMLLLLSILTSCGYIHAGQLKNLKNKEYKNFKVYYMESLPDAEIQDFDRITEGMKEYLEKSFNVETRNKTFSVAILPLDNKVVNFEKQGSSACTDYKNIYLLDFYNLPKEIYSQYGEAPKDIYNNAYAHELAHLLTRGNIDYKKKNKLDTNELNSVFFTYIDFKTEELGETPTLKEDFKTNFTQDKISQISEKGLASLSDATKDRTLGIFLYYLHLNKEYNRTRLFLEADNLRDFMNRAGWTQEDDKGFLDWLNSCKVKYSE